MRTGPTISPTSAENAALLNSGFICSSENQPNLPPLGLLGSMKFPGSSEKLFANDAKSAPFFNLKTISSASSLVLNESFWVDKMGHLTNFKNLFSCCL